MNRRVFTKQICLYCVAGAVSQSVLTSCQAAHYATGTLDNKGISVSKSEFNYMKKDKPQVRSWIIVRNDALQFPIYLYRFSDNEFSAVLMKCTHQGTELQAAGDHLHCPGHGSEFDNRGKMIQGPAETALRSFKTIADVDKVFIDLS
jgi:Rieske Fe-S protein